MPKAPLRPLTAFLAALVFAGPALGQGADVRRSALEALTQEEDALEAQLGADRNALAHLLGALELFVRDPPPPLIVSARDAKDAVNAMILARAIANELEARQQELAARSAALAGLRRAADVASGDLFEADSELADREGRLGALARDAALMAPPRARRAMEAQAASPAPSQILPPVDAPLAARFGGVLASRLRAEGLAWRTSPGAPVRSPAAGVVAYVGPVNGWGEVVILRAGGGCHMVLSGLGKVTETEGQSVAAGAPLGSMPPGGQTPPELYLEVRMASGPVDPERLMGRARVSSVNASGLRLRREGVD